MAAATYVTIQMLTFGMRLAASRTYLSHPRAAITSTYQCKADVCICRCEYALSFSVFIIRDSSTSMVDERDQTRASKSE